MWKKVVAVVILLIFTTNGFSDSISVEITATGQIVPNDDTPVYMKSQNITVYLDKKIHEITEYCLENPTNTTENLIILLPFSGNQSDLGDVNYHSKPINLELKIDGFVLNYTWTVFDWKSQKFDAIIFNVSIIKNKAPSGK